MVFIVSLIVLLLLARWISALVRGSPISVLVVRHPKVDGELPTEQRQRAQ